jgi:tetratricopeptide (TPR) repeat protein
MAAASNQIVHFAGSPPGRPQAAQGRAIRAEQGADQQRLEQQRDNQPILNPARDPLSLAAVQPGVTVAQLESRDSAINWFEAEQRALQLCQRLGDQAGQARVQLYQSVASERKGQWPEALGHAEQALGLFRASGHLPGQARAMNNVGWCRAHLGEHREAQRICQQAISLHREVADCRGEAAAWDSLGYSHRCLDDYSEAITCYQHAVELYAEVGDHPQAEDARTRLRDARSMLSR